MSASRRDFLASAAVLAVGAGFARSAEPEPKLKLTKAVKYGMIRVEGSYVDKLAAVKRAGFVGVEIDSPSNLKLDELIKASQDTGIKIHGVVDSAHWRDTLSSPDEAVRAKGLAALKTAIADAKTVGASTVLLVPGVVNDKVTFQECWDRSTAEVKKALPDAEKNGIKIAFEVVWNNFITKPEQFVEYVDQFQSPWVGAYMDFSNMLKYGVPGAVWIKTLGKRTLKHDIKGFNMKKFEAKQNPWVPIGEGTEDWPDVRKALAEVGYEGWVTAEVGGGDEKHLADIAARMDKVLGL